MDGSADPCSSRSSVDKSQPPSPAVAAIVDEAGNEDDDSNQAPPASDNHPATGGSMPEIGRLVY